MFSGKALFAVAAWGGSFIATRIALESVSPYFLLAARSVLGFLVLAALFGPRQTKTSLKLCASPRILLIGLIIAAHLLMQAIGLQYTSAINTGWIIGLGPIGVAFGSWIFLKQGLSATGWAGVLIGVVGVGLVTIIEPPNFANAHFGDLIQVISCATFAAMMILAVRPIRESGATQFNLSTLAICCLLAVAIACFDAKPLTKPIELRQGVALLYLGVLVSGLATHAWIVALSELGPTKTSVYLYIEPLFTLLAAVQLLDEPITWNACAGGVVVLIGVYLVKKSPTAK